MTIRAVDIVTMMPRLQEAGRMQHQDQVQSLVGYQALSALQQLRAEKAQHQVMQAPCSRDAAIRKEDRRQNRGGQEAMEQPEQGQRQARRTGARCSRGHRLDIKV
ncbi:MAG TPA: hypothetical protein VIL07_03355 [Symbiobacteriaceae bacterium]